MEEDTEYLKLPVEDRCVHKNWKARVHGYEEAKKLFNQITDEKSSEWNKFLGLMKKMVVDSNAVAQEKGLEAVLVFVENSAAAGKTVGEVMSGLVTKCVAAPKTKTKDLTAQIALMYIEIEKQDIAMEELLKGTEQKNPKIVSGCVNIMTQAIREFGIKSVNIKPLVKRLPSLLEDRDKNVRDESKAMAIEIYRWIGEALSPQLTALKPVQITELQAEFAKVRGEKAVPTRYLRSQQAKQAKIAAETGDTEECRDDDECDDGGGAEVDPYEMMVAVDILSRLSKDWQDKIEAKKWQERKEVLDAVDQMLQGGPKLENGDYGDLVRALKKMVTKDSNVVVVALAAKCMTGIANGLKKRFQPYATACISGLLEKFREKKQTVVTALREAVDAIFISTTLEAIQEDVLAALENKNPSVKAETAAFLARCFTKCTPLTLNKKLLKVFTAALLKTLNEPDPTVRDNSADALGTAMKVVSEKAMSPFLADVDSLKMSKIKDACEKAELQVKQPKTVAKKPASTVVPDRPATAKPTAGSAAPKPVKRPNTSAGKKQSPTNIVPKTTSGRAKNVVEQYEAEAVQSNEEEQTQHGIVDTEEDLDPVVKRVDITSFITDALVNEMSDKNWKVRAEAVQKLQKIVTDNKKISVNLGECSPVLAARLVDSNTKIAASAFALCQSLATALGSQGKQYVRAFFPNFLVGMGDSKTWIRSAAIACVNTWGEQCGFREFFEGEMVADALKSGSPTLRSELWAWLAEQLPNIKSVPKEEMVACVPVLLTNLEDRNADVRKNAGEAVLGVMMHAGYQPLYSACDKLKPGSQGPIKIILEKARGCLPEKFVLKSKSSSNIPDKGKVNAKMGPGSTATFTKSKAKPMATAGAKPVARAKKDDDVDTSPLLQLNSLKNQRVIDEQKLKTLKWNFTTPRDEFVDLLKDQMTTAGVNKALMANMFHSDFKYHLRAIDSLNEDLALNADAQTANLDLILRWLTLRFFDTNPSVLLKGLEYLQTLFTILIDNQYNMLENEATSFLPYLILKIGDPKDAVRNNVRALLKQIWSVYPISKLFLFLMDGIKSKNARQRTECLEHMCLLMETFGIGVCQPTPSAALKEIAKQISDRDNSVRTAALNCIVTAYFLEGSQGERVLKMVGQISDKDMSLLEERIKRAAKTRPVASVKPLPQTIPRPSVAPARVPSPVYDPEPEEEEEPLPPPPPIHSHNSHSPVERGENINHIVEVSPIMPDSNNCCQNSQNVHNEDNNDENSIHEEPEEPCQVEGPYRLDVNLLENIETRPVICSQPKLIEFDFHFLKEPSAQINAPAKLDNCLTMSPLSKMSNSMSLEWQLSHIGNHDIDQALEGMQHIESLLTSDQHHLLQHHEDLLVAQLVRNLEFLNQSNSPEVVNCYKRNLGLMVKLFGNHHELSCKVKEATLREAIKTLITLLTENRLEMLDPGTDMFVRVVNNVVIRILDKSEHTAIICALVKNLYDTVNNPGVSTHYQELLMKCIWKVIKFLEVWADELQYDLIFVDIHAFLRDYPSSWWKRQPSDTPLRTIKTIMHTIVKLKGLLIGEVVKNVRGVTPESELWTYVQKLLKHIKVADNDVHVPPPQVDNREIKHNRSPKVIHDQLTEIFRMISHKEETHEGVRLLYDFKQQYPETDIAPYLQKSSQFFQDFIARGLKSIEADRRLAGHTDLKIEPEDNDSGQYLQRLRAWQAKAGWNNAPPAATRPTPLSPPPPVNEPLPVRHSQLDISSDSISADENEVEALRRRLEKVRRNAHR